ncbi:hypothetical protein [Nitrososphaera sp. AFS]|uniref:hypothetical protein n=1 Tax=Nitrososphaera sp. AFS TaxID=2301191 RepID=UPI0019177F4E|nr:hypothetical protein [Nitrososphaera sp. AFS]NAL78408.1 hypothetical protein [Nitrososphaera sp. AFS]
MSDITQLLNKQQYQKVAQRYMQPAEGSIEKQVHDFTRSELKSNRISQAKSYWYNPAVDHDLIEKSQEGYRPEPQSIYFGESFDGGNRPTWEVKCFDYGAYSNYLHSADASTDSHASRFDSLVGVFGPEISGQAYEYLRSKEAGGTITSSDFSNIQILANFIDILDVQQRQFSIINAVTTKATNTLAIQTLAYSRFGITEEIGELESPESRKGQFTSQTFKLKKLGGLIAWSDEAEMQNWASGVNPIDYTRQNLASDAVRIKAGKIAASLASLTTASTSAADWSAYTTDHSTTNPLIFIQNVYNEIYANYGTMDTIASTPRTYSFFASNTHVSGQTASPAIVLGPGQVPAKGLTGYQWYVDPSLTENYVYMYDKRGIWFLQGPSKIENYRNSQTGENGVIYREWCNSFVKETGFGKKATGISPT